MESAEPLWRPSSARIERARITAFLRWLEHERGLAFADYEALWNWSVTDLEAFWDSLWHFLDIRASRSYEKVLGSRSMPGAEWFPGARLNLVDQVFRHVTDTRPAIVAGDESGALREMSWRELQAQVEALAATLRRLGVVPGDRIVAILPNVPQTMVAFLACASVGAIWSVCSPDMGPVAVLDRFRQIAPKVLIACDGYRYAGKAHDRTEVLADIVAELPSVETLIIVPILHEMPDLRRFPRAMAWASALEEAPAHGPELQTEQLPPDHPLWVVYSSGTTGLPKAIVHGHSGVLLEMLKGVHLHRDIGIDDRFFWYTTTGWIMWNVQMSGLLAGATVILYDGHPGTPDLGALWRFVARVGATFFGAGAAFFANCIKAGIDPSSVARLTSLRTLGSTGSPLPADAYRWLYRHVKSDLWLVSIAGGTDLAGAFLTGLVTLPVYAGEMQCRALGLKVESWDDAGRPLLDGVGELVCTEPFPSLPLRFWGDVDGARYRDSYFEPWPGVWRHGDWMRLVPRPEAIGGIIYGRSDATINRHGIRMGTAELYRAVELLPEVIDSLVVDLEYLGRESWMPLFVVLRPDAELDESLKQRINETIRESLSARHVPSEIIVVPEVPRTLSGKKMELPIKRLLLGHPVDKIAHADAMANPASLAWFVAYARDRASKVALTGR